MQQSFKHFIRFHLILIILECPSQAPALPMMARVRTIRIDSLLDQPKNKFLIIIRLVLLLRFFFRNASYLRNFSDFNRRVDINRGIININPCRILIFVRFHCLLLTILSDQLFIFFLEVEFRLIISSHLFLPLFLKLIQRNL